MKREPALTSGNTRQRGGPSRRARYLGMALTIGIVLALVYFQKFETRLALDTPTLPEPPAGQLQPRHEGEKPPTVDAIVEGMQIRNLEGRVVFRGAVDVSQTVARIERDEQLSFPNDGATFQNREGRLPRKPAGYYREWVHPTPGLRGPGPQRIVTGEQGEIYYTPDHYRTFHRLGQGESDR